MSQDREFYVVSNWKMINGHETVEALCKLLHSAKLDDEVNVVIGCPFPYIMLAKRLLPEKIHLAGLNCHKMGSNGYTGEITPNILKDVGAKYVILGHSDRRQYFQETDAIIADKAANALDAGLSVMICIGENFQSHASGNMESVLALQLSALRKHIRNWNKVLLVYEPIWTMGTGKSARPHNVQTALAFIRKWLEMNISRNVATSTPLLYGGTITGANCRMLAIQTDLDGFLVGNSSLRKDFIEIINTFVPTEEEKSSTDIYSQIVDAVSLNIQK